MALILGLSCGELSLYPNVDLLFWKKIFFSHSRTIILTKTWHGTQCCWWVQLYFSFNICVGEAHSCWCGLMLSSHTLPQGDRVTTLVSCLSHVLSEVHRERYRGIVAHSSMYSLFYISPTQVIPQKNIWIEVYVGKNIGCRALMENLCHLQCYNKCDLLFGYELVWIKYTYGRSESIEHYINSLCWLNSSNTIKPLNWSVAKTWLHLLEYKR